jgi:putative copper resistance protein D
MRRVWSLVLVLISFSCLPAQARQSMSDGHPGHEMSMTNNPLDPAAQAKLLADKKESQFNHHLAGFFVALGGVIILFQRPLGKRFPLVKYIWPASFLLSGVFVLVWSDTELWPFGGRHWLEALQNNREVLQHKTYAVLLLALGLVEWLRVRGTLKAAWSGMVFPLLAIGGSVLLLFHQHEAGMNGPNHMEVMARIQSEHLSYAVVGFGIGLAKGLSEIRMRGYHFLARVWPVLMVALGILLMSYRE